MSATVSYFDRCRDLLEPAGVLLFASYPSHAPAHEGQGLTGVCPTFGAGCEIEKRRD